MNKAQTTVLAVSGLVLLLGGSFATYEILGTDAENKVRSDEMAAQSERQINEDNRKFVLAMFCMKHPDDGRCNQPSDIPAWQKQVQEMEKTRQ